MGLTRISLIRTNSFGKPRRWQLLVHPQPFARIRAIRVRLFFIRVIRVIRGFNLYSEDWNRCSESESVTDWNRNQNRNRWGERMGLTRISLIRTDSLGKTAVGGRRPTFSHWREFVQFASKPPILCYLRVLLFKPNGLESVFGIGIRARIRIGIRIRVGRGLGGFRGVYGSP